MYPAVSSVTPATLTDTFSASWLSTVRMKRIFLRFRIISIIPSITPGIAANSWSTPATLTVVIAYPSNEESRIRRKALPMVIPNPGSSGRNSNFPNDEVDSSMITFSGFWNANIAIMNLLLNYYLEYNSTISCSLMFSGISSRSGFWRNLPLIVAPSHSSHA